MADEKKDFNTDTLLNEHAKDISSLSEKADKCYSSERYEDFQEAVEKITGRYLKGNVGWAIALWIVTLLGTMLVQKFFKVL